MLQKIPLRRQSALGIFPGGAVSCVLFIDCSAYREGRRPDAINHSTWQRRAVLGVMVPQISMTEPGSLNARRQVAPAFVGGLSLSTALKGYEPPTLSSIGSLWLHFSNVGNYVLFGVVGLGRRTRRLAATSDIRFRRRPSDTGPLSH